MKKIFTSSLLTVVFFLFSLLAKTQVAPEIQCPPNITITAPPNSCTAEVFLTGANAVTATGRPTPVITYNFSFIMGNGSYSIDPTTLKFTASVGVTIRVTATATNLYGSANCSFTVTVLSGTPPEITCPENITVFAALGQTTAGAGYRISAQHDCDIPYSLSIDGGVPINANGFGTFAVDVTKTYSLGTRAISAIATDAAGNSSTCSFNITVNEYLPPPTVTINQAAGQSDPTSASPIHFTVTFNQAVTGFTSSDISVTGSTPFMLLIPVVTVTGGPLIYDVAVSGMTASGTLVATVPAGAALNAGSQSNLASTSTDNSVVYNIPPCTLTCPSNITVAATSLSGAVVNYSVTPDGDCRNIVRIPVPGTTFPVGTTTVNAYNNVSTGLVYGLSRSTDINSGFLINELVTFNVNTAGPTTLSTPIPITGISFPMVAIDFRPSNGQLYGLEIFWLSNHYGGKIYTINKNTGVATPLTLDDFDLSDASSFDIDFDPVTDILRVTDGKGTNLRIDPDLGTVLASDPALSVGFIATAYSNTFASSTFSTLYEINSLTNALYIQGGINGVPSPNTGSTTLVGPLGIDVEGDFTGFDGFDISLSAGAHATFLVDGAHKLYSINLNSGAATLIGTFNGSVIDIAIAPVTLPAPSCSFTVTVTPPVPNVTINKASTQADPTSGIPIHFTVVFDQDVTGFDASDISLAGSTTQGTLVATVTGSGTTYDVSVTGMTTQGIVIASVIAGAATNNSGQTSTASTSTDNVVLFLVIPHNLVIIKQGPSTVIPGNNLSYLLTVVNNSSTPVLGITVTDVLPPGTTFIGMGLNPALYTVIAPPAGQNGTINIYFPGLSPGAQVNIPFGVKSDALQTENITNTAIISGPPGDVNANDNSSTVTTQIVVPPTITCPSNLTVSTGSNNCIGVVDLGSLPFTLTGTPAPTLKISFRQQDNPLTLPIIVDVTPGTFSPMGFAKGISTVTATASNGVDPDATCQFTVTVLDQTAPVITCPTNINVNANQGVCYATLSNATIGTATATDNCDGTITISHSSYPAGNNFPVGTTNITWTATDASGNTSTCIQTITVNDNQPPVIENINVDPSILWPPNHQMKNVEVKYTSRDNCGVVNCRLEITSNEPINGTGDGDTDPDWEVVDDHHVKLRAERAANGDGRTYTITIICSDGHGNETRQTVAVIVAHNITAPHSGQSFKVGSTVSFAGTFWDKPGNKHTGKWVIDNSTTVSGTVTEPTGTKNGKVTGSYKFTTPGVYKLQMNVTDQKGIMSYANTNGDIEAIVVIYDPNGGYTYGGGYYDSHSGALVSNPSSTGKASYGFAMNYFKNSTNPKGETQFEFKVGDFEFNALNFDYLVISNSMAQFKGTGKIIGGQSGVAFTMTVTDGQLNGSGVDKIRMKIYNKNNGKIIYDNQPGASDAALPTQTVGANSIIVISGTNSSLTSANTNQKTEMEVTETKTVNGLDVIAYPNPSINNFSITVQASAKEKIMMQVVDMYGRIIETRNVSANSITRFGDRYATGTYFVRIMQGKEHKEIKLIKLAD